MSLNEIELLANYLTESDQIKLLFGNDKELQHLLSILLYTLLLNGNKPQTSTTAKYDFIDINYNEKYQELSNLLIKFMLFHPKFNKEFVSRFLTLKENKCETDEQLEKGIEEVEHLLESNSGNFIENIVPTKHLTDAFNAIIDDLSKELFPLFKEKLKQLIYDNEIIQQVTTYVPKAKQSQTTSDPDIISPQLNEKLKFEVFSRTLTNNDVVHFLNGLFFKQTLDLNKNMYYLSFISQYHLQRLWVIKLSNAMKSLDSFPFSDDKDMLKTDQYYSDIKKITDYYLGVSDKKILSLSVPTYPEGIDESDFEP
ncbi:hypothetical protein [Streptococcus acidominimus]|uniref:Uncharacterized protein n=1 Tax=Streptococcus acidominimus TaxID=1326 RepID=A0A4Y9FLY3_STRAI|nr:hypothetical protein [Streptococcus acidominimus]MBF0819480.1 hypothetical protein [Streptococcus acidominimus]MBF0839905.1 hypothetical protein [Streptococcus acidominimus]MBF0847698.1 hypothetical protein [Streptococcus danieliae]TFU29852.1 hypothetical protein E4U01_08500 [Streptococcus acidominimus]